MPGCPVVTIARPSVTRTTSIISSPGAQSRAPDFALDHIPVTRDALIPAGSVGRWFRIPYCADISITYSGKFTLLPAES